MGRVPDWLTWLYVFGKVQKFKNAKPRIRIFAAPPPDPHTTPDAQNASQERWLCLYIDLLLKLAAPATRVSFGVNSSENSPTDCPWISFFTIPSIHHAP